MIHDPLRPKCSICSEQLYYAEYRIGVARVYGWKHTCQCFKHHSSTKADRSIRIHIPGVTDEKHVLEHEHASDN